MEQQPVQPTIEEDYEDAECQDSIDAIISLLTKSHRCKARVILESGNIPFQHKSLHVMYPDGELGSHLIELLQYV